MEPVSRSRIAKRLRMTAPTVLRVVEQLLQENLIRVSDRKTSKTTGRPSQLLEFNGTEHMAIAVSIGVMQTTAVLVDLCGNIRSTEDVSHELSSGDVVFRSVVVAIERLLSRVELDEQSVRGIVLGVPGIVENPGGRVVNAPGLHWENLDIRSQLQERFGYQVFIENDVNLNALGELGFGAARGLETSVSIIMGRGLGAGIILNGSLYHGTHSAAGEIGYFPRSTEVVGDENGDIGRMLNLTMGEGIEAGLIQSLHSHGYSVGDQTVTPEHLFAEAKQGRDWAVAAVKEMARSLSMAVAGIALLFDPELVVLGGDVGSKYGDVLLPEVIPLVRSQVPIAPPVVVSTLGTYATAMGAIMLIIHGTTNRVRISLPRWSDPAE
jgi:glucokinase